MQAARCYLVLSNGLKDVRTSGTSEWECAWTANAVPDSPSCRDCSCGIVGARAERQEAEASDVRSSQRRQPNRPPSTTAQSAVRSQMIHSKAE